ncbi:MAG: SDR family NAD(P)-dependent oxidoreductase [Dissulfurimicrobium sp.]|uniref:SDR family NAD(P)-dependent oxidoreductase n=1 Tax=Dissulfurimicrobium TaxID=1769732 RepID=UPI001EDBEA0D|nr:SDR family NAD(P)-dependent oxidoreductase [Dissulfurimicrobium hydrothermale]UKL14315.1 SDR family oxidoreductase [Dissulfurimicrobium hydrothermale]
MKLSGKTAIVTGAIKGIGLAIAAGLARMRVQCVVTYYDWLEELPNMHKTLRNAGAEYHAVAVDLTAPGGAEKVIDETMRRFGRLDILINNIERGGWPIVHGEYTKRQWELEFNTTITAKWMLFKQALPLLKKTGNGTVVNISSIAGIIGRCGPAAKVFHDCYSLSNRAIRTLTETWAREAAPEVRVNELMLGFFDTRHGPGTRGWGLLCEDEKKAIIDHTLLKRTGAVHEVAQAVNFLVRDATFMTGAIIRLDGGYILGGEAAGIVPKGIIPPDEPGLGGTAVSIQT